MSIGSLISGLRALGWATLVACFALCPRVGRAQGTESLPLDQQFESVVRPLLARYCEDCHSGEEAEGDIDLAAFRTIADVRQQDSLWLKVRQMLESRQMPPNDAPQPTDQEFEQLRTWVRDHLAGVARLQAGDPGPVILRRLTNAEYNYTLRDLTGVQSLDPTREFPVDGAAGEGFTNVGTGQGMSPALVRKYLDAAKQVAAHAVLLPDGIRFSARTTRRDQTDELLGRIQAFYRRYTADGGGTTVNLDGNPFTTNQGGRLPLEAYVRATIEERESIRNGTSSPEQVARQRGLSGKYLRTLWQALSSEASSLLLDPVRRPWQVADQDDAGGLIAHIEGWQPALWQFHSIGHFGREGGATAWMEPKPIIGTSHQFRFRVPESPDEADVTVSLTAHDLNDGNEQDIALWRQPRIEFDPGEGGTAHPPVLLRDVRSLVPRVRQAMMRELPRTPEYLAALVDLSQGQEIPAEVAESRKLNPRLLANWSVVTGLGQPVKREITGHFSTKLTAVHGYAALNGWGQGGEASLLTNRSNETIEFLTITMPARAVTVHPWPEVSAVVSWRSPIDARLQIAGLVADADAVCGNGGQWQIELLSETGRHQLAEGAFDNGGANDVTFDEPVAVVTGDIVSLIIGSRDRNHVCDTTQIDLTFSEIDGDRVWNLVSDIVDTIQDGNPLPDSYGHEQIWHFCGRGETTDNDVLIPPGSALSEWRTAVDTMTSEQQERLAEDVTDVLTTDAAELNDPDSQLRRTLLDWTGPLDWVAVAQESSSAVSSNAVGLAEAGTESTYGVDPALFGTHPHGAAVDEADLCAQAPLVIHVRLPVELARRASILATGELHPQAGDDATVQLLIVPGQPVSPYLAPSAPLLVRAGSAAERRLRTAVDEFRQLFPPALCYARIVPVDEVVTLTLFHREDEPLKRLMLEVAEAEELDRLWEELRFVSQEPLRLVVAYEQISEFATQDRPDLVKAFAPMRQQILVRAEAFQQQQVAVEPYHVDAVVRLAGRAWRRPLTKDELDSLRSTYDELRATEIAHEEAIQLLLARVFTAPALLFKLEHPAEGTTAAPVSGLELATRLSYFLWSSLPDTELRQAAEAGQLAADDVLAAQSRRMLSDARTRRLAIHFACQWLHLREFDRQNDKNEQLYPQFAALRADMYEETVRFFEDLFRNNGSILEILDADHTFLNDTLAAHYDVDGVPEGGWQRVEGIREGGRGGILGMATVLASQSGASRSSPILRGNWVVETLLGERLPKPPPGVPQLPEQVPGNLTARQLIEQHSSVPECAKCHRRIDPYGFALEQFDTIGRRRAEASDTRTTLVDGTKIDGLAGLRKYLVTTRRDDFVNQFCRKLLGYALGREVQLSDEPLLEQMHAILKANDYRFRTAVEAMITSPQFRNIRPK